MKWGWDYSRQVSDTDVVPLARLRNKYSNAVSLEDSDDGIDLTDPISFKVEAVQGGTLVETRWYDHKRDEHIRKLHIVNGEENLADAIGKIVTMELIRK
jgi:hypothetical protein